MIQELTDILKKHWGYASFRPVQEKVIRAVMEQKDTLALMPTGGGKSICFQVPALAGEGMCLVISPLIALMKDQVANLKKRDIPSLSIHSGMSFPEVKRTLENALYGNFRFLYVSPERLETSLFLEYVGALNIRLIAVDEAHCISQWGYDFRPPYLRIASIREYFPDIPILALTATATPEVQKDICEKLAFRNGYAVFQQSFERPQLSFSALELSSKQHKLLEMVKKVKGSGIVYCRTRKRTREIASLLQANGIPADFYHAGLSSEERSKKQDDWIHDRLRIIVCTNAFGMGIDKPDVRLVVHYDVPDALENYYQEAGRAGRDDRKAYAVLFYAQEELDELKRLSDKKFPDKKIIRKIYGDLCNLLQLPSGTGKGLCFDFDINAFAKNFGHDAYIISSVLKILEQEELVSYNEQFFSPSTVVFSADKISLSLFEKSHPAYTEVIRGLLRSYEGIFDFPAAINEVQLATFTGIRKEDMAPMLRELAAYGMITYSPQKEQPQICFLHNRAVSDDLFINEKNILQRKEAYEKRCRAMAAYPVDRKECRSVIIARYFNDLTVKKCGICDNCISRQSSRISGEEFKMISGEIRTALAGEAVTYPVLIQDMPFNENNIHEVLTYLLEEKIVSVDQEGKISLIKK